MALRDATTAETQQAYGQTEERALVQFFMQPKRNSAKSKEAGRDIFESVEYIKIMTPGNKDNIPCDPVTDIHRQRFAAQYKRWLETRDEEAHIEGTLLEEWPGVSRSQVEELRFFHVHTVEQLAEMADADAQGFMGINSLREKARQFLEASEKVAANAETMKLRGENAMLTEQIKELQAAVKVLQEDRDRPKRGRPRKQTDEATDE